MKSPRTVALDVQGEALLDVGGFANIEARVYQFRWPPVLVFNIYWALARAFEDDVPVCGHELRFLANPPKRIHARFLRQIKGSAAEDLGNWSDGGERMHFADCLTFKFRGHQRRFAPMKGEVSFTPPRF